MTEKLSTIQKDLILESRALIELSKRQKDKEALRAILRDYDMYGSENAYLRGVMLAVSWNL